MKANVTFFRWCQLLIFSCCAFSFSKAIGQTKIEGIGKFKINKTTLASLDTLAVAENLTRIPVHTQSGVEMYKKSSDVIMELMPDNPNPTTDTAPFEATICPEAKVFLISSITIAGIEIKNMYLSFYKNKLIKLEMDSSPELEEAFEIKYGDGKIRKEEKSVTCLYQLTGNQVQFQSKTFYRTWENGNIICSSVMGEYMDRDCEKQRLRYISIYNLPSTSLISDCESRITAAQEKKERDAKRKKLDGL